MGQASHDDSNPSSQTDIVARFREAMLNERRALRDLLREHRDLHEQNLELVHQLVDQPDESPGAEDLRESLKQQEIRYGLLKVENAELVSSHQKVLEENNNLFKLYIASHRLHSSLAMGEVLEVISEIILNLVGADCYAIFFYDESEKKLAPVLVRGIEREEVPNVLLGEGAIGNAALSSQKYVMVEQEDGGEVSPDTPLSVIPLRFRDRLLGVVAMYRLLSHKHELREVDYALFDYLATHAAMALHSAMLYTEAEKKVSKMKEFLSLMQTPAGDARTREGGVAR